LAQSQVRFNRVPEKVPEKFPGSLCAKTSQVQRVPEKVEEKVPEKVLGIFIAGPGLVQRVQQVQQGFQRLASQHASERFIKMKRCGCWGYHRSLFLFSGKGFCSIMDFLVLPASGWGSGACLPYSRSVPDSSMNFAMRMTLVETCNVAVWCLCWCNYLFLPQTA